MGANNGVVKDTCFHLIQKMWTHIIYRLRHGVVNSRVQFYNIRVNFKKTRSVGAKALMTYYYTAYTKYYLCILYYNTFAIVRHRTPRW